MASLPATLAVAAAVLGGLPFATFLFLGSLVTGAGNPVFSRTGLWACLFALVAVVGFGMFFGMLTLVKAQNCPREKRSAAHVAKATALSTALALAFALLSLAAPARRIVLDLLPESMDRALATSIAVSYFLVWGGLFGASVGGTLSAICTAP
jgi:hypothetical protein